MKQRRIILLLVAVLMQVATFAQHSPDFAEKFMKQHEGDSTLKCITVSPKMMEQLVKSHDDNRPDHIVQAIAKLKSARIITGNADHYVKAEELLKRNSQRFIPAKEYRTDNQHGAFYTRKDKKGNTVEFIMLCEEPQHDRCTIINLTGDIDEEFLCFLYNKSFN
jgi:molybdenum cofactor biosynthesis enzyme MoaA